MSTPLDLTSDRRPDGVTVLTMSGLADVTTVSD